MAVMEIIKGKGCGVVRGFGGSRGEEIHVLGIWAASKTTY